MKSIFRKIFILLFVLFLAVGCSQNKSSGNENKVNNSNNEGTVQQEKEANKNAYENIDKIVVPIEQEWVNGLVAYQEFNIAVINYIGEKYNIPVEVKEITNFEDAMIALDEGRVNVVTGVSNNINTNLETTYSYLSSPLYFPDGIEAIEHRSYKMAVSKENKDLLKLLNDAIFTMKESGELEKIKVEYLGERENKDHPTLDELTSWDAMEKMTEEERDELVNKLDEYTKLKD